MTKTSDFKLSPQFTAEYENRPVPWGFGDLSYITYKRTYARPVEGEDRTEEWWETCRRVIEGMFTLQKRHCRSLGLPWDNVKATSFAQNAYDRLFNLKWTPPGRGLWMMGSPAIMEGKAGAGLFNCGFTTTRDIDQDFSRPFTWAFLMSMLGVGVGFDTRGAGTVEIVEPEKALQDDRIHIVPDSREGWAGALGRLLNAFTGKGTLPEEWDVSKVRPKGAPIKTFGGVASGPEPLTEMLETLHALYAEKIGRRIDSELIVDTMNIVARCVVSGGVRRSAMISLGALDDDEFMDLKLDQEKLGEWRWSSNNSIFACKGMDYTEAAKRTAANGEPGYMWLENARAFGRMKDPADWKDKGAEGANPCQEQTLWNKELCCLVESYPANHTDFEDFKETLRVAYQYAKTVTLVQTHDEQTNAVMLKNRRIGLSMTGIIQAINKHSYRGYMDWCDKGYEYVQYLDKKYSDWLCIPRSIKTTSVKPSGTVSILSGSTPGVHWDHGEYYIRRVRLRDTHDLVDVCREAGYLVEKDVYAPNTVVVEFPVHAQNVTRSKDQVSAWEKVKLAADMQYYWADNQVSCTVEFDPDTEGAQIPQMLSMFEDKLKGISFLPMRDHGYAQAPYETITREEYERRAAALKPINAAFEHDQEDKFCSGVACEVDLT